MLILGFFIGLLVGTFSYEKTYTCGHLSMLNNKFSENINDKFRLINDFICPLKSN